jgi:sugar phosphate isomerase/epimerase
MERNKIFGGRPGFRGAPFFRTGARLLHGTGFANSDLKRACQSFRVGLFFRAAILLALASCRTPHHSPLVFAEYPQLKLGFSTQNFQKAMPIDVQSEKTFIEYAAAEGYEFIELRDNLAAFTTDECHAIAATARKNDIDVIYEIQINPLDTAYGRVFTKALANTRLFPGPGVLRALLSQSEFDADSTKKGWTKEELVRVARILDSTASVAAASHVRLIVENLNEPFFRADTLYGLSDLFAATTLVGLQFDIGNPFRNSSRGKADPAAVSAWLSANGPRWVTSHLKTLQQGGSQPFLTDNPLPVEEVVRLMGRENVVFATIELLPVTDRQQCFDNHARSIRFLRDKGLLKK